MATLRHMFHAWAHRISPPVVVNCDAHMGQAILASLAGKNAGSEFMRKSETSKFGLKRAFGDYNLISELWMRSALLEPVLHMTYSKAAPTTNMNAHSAGIRF
eukprot:5442114-Amphidinium_carterae.1